MAGDSISAKQVPMSRIPLVFLPGLICDAALWQQQADALSDIADATIADLTHAISIAEMADQVLASAPPQFALAGLSMGGYVALEMMRRAPQRVLKLALFDTSAAPDPAERAAQRRAGLESLKLGKFVGVTTKMLPQLVHAQHLESEVGEAVMAMAARVGSQVFIRQQEAILERDNYLPTLTDIKVPTLVAIGDSDILTPMQHSLDIHWGIKGSRFHVFKNCGHLPALEVPQETTMLLRRWLAPNF